MSNKKVQKTYTDHGCGFPVIIKNAPLVKIRKDWVLDLNLEKLEIIVILNLAFKDSRLTGNEVKFIRHFFEMTLTSFGERFGNVAHSAVIKWEKFGDEATNMNWACEKDIRLHIICILYPEEFLNLYNFLIEKLPSNGNEIEVDAKEVLAA